MLRSTLKNAKMVSRASPIYISSSETTTSEEDEAVPHIVFVQPSMEAPPRQLRIRRTPPRPVPPRRRIQADAEQEAWILMRIRDWVDERLALKEAYREYVVHSQEASDT